MGETRLLAIDIQTAAGGPLEPASVYPLSLLKILSRQKLGPVRKPRARRDEPARAACTISGCRAIQHRYKDSETVRCRPLSNQWQAVVGAVRPRGAGSDDATRRPAVWR